MNSEALFSSLILSQPKQALVFNSDPEAFAELYRRHVRSIYRYHLAHTGDIKDAEDLTSQTFMAALEGIRSYRGTINRHITPCFMLSLHWQHPKG